MPRCGHDKLVVMAVQDGTISVANCNLKSICQHKSRQVEHFISFTINVWYLKELKYVASPAATKSTSNVNTKARPTGVSKFL